jgi:hypothetical protein
MHCSNPEAIDGVILAPAATLIHWRNISNVSIAKSPGDAGLILHFVVYQ